MKRLLILMISGVLAVSFLAACNGEGDPTTGERKIKYWQAPMDPNFIADKPGKSPMGMDLIPVYEDEAAESSSGAVAIDPVIIQSMGVRVERAQRQTIYRHIRTIGEIEVGEDKISVVNLRFSGWVEKIYADRTGDPVEKGGKLFDIYSPELVAAQEDYLLALRTQGRESELARSVRRKLGLWNLSSSDIEAMAKSGKSRRVMPVRAPRSGFILQKSVVEGARIQAGKDLYHIGDLSRIWVTAEVYEYDAPWVEVGQPAQMELTHYQGKVIEGSVGYVYPTLSKTSRTLTVRLEFDNPGYRLKPGMFATVYIQFRKKDDALGIPSEAILHSGRRKIVFVAKEEGKFEPHEVTTGLVGDRHVTEVISGLSEGDLVVASGQFLIDSESQLQESIQKMLARRSPVEDARPSISGDMEVMPETLWSCPMHPEEISSELGRCPVCGMDLENRNGTSEERQRLYQKRLDGPEREFGDANLHEPHGQSSHDRSLTVEGVGDGEDKLFTCPQHPGSVFDEPGRCPLCGVFLEKDADEEAVE